MPYTAPATRVASQLVAASDLTDQDATAPAQLEDDIATPEHIHGVRSIDDYRAFAVQFGQHTSRFVALTITDQLRPVYVSTGRWLVRCVCSNPPSAHPEWQRAICLGCGREWIAVFPEWWAAIEACLTVRPVVHRNWDWYETLADLEQENADHDLAARAED